MQISTKLRRIRSYQKSLSIISFAARRRRRERKYGGKKKRRNERTHLTQIARFQIPKLHEDPYGSHPDARPLQQSHPSKFVSRILWVSSRSGTNTTVSVRVLKKKSREYSSAATATLTRPVWDPERKDEHGRGAGILTGFWWCLSNGRLECGESQFVS